MPKTSKASENRARGHSTYNDVSRRINPKLDVSFLNLMLKCSESLSQIGLFRQKIVLYGAHAASILL
jgi:hypothetical protein